MPITKYSAGALKKLVKKDLIEHITELYDFIDVFDNSNLIEQLNYKIKELKVFKEEYFNGLENLHQQLKDKNERFDTLYEKYNLSQYKLKEEKSGNELLLNEIKKNLKCISTRNKDIDSLIKEKKKLKAELKELEGKCEELEYQYKCLVDGDEGY
tara:strand:- start:1220 stop:1684 length:465 start_codon:yes stop_codon:yes gene_type:complete